MLGVRGKGWLIQQTLDFTLHSELSTGLSFLDKYQTRPGLYQRNAVWCNGQAATSVYTPTHYDLHGLANVHRYFPFYVRYSGAMGVPLGKWSLPEAMSYQKDTKVRLSTHTWPMPPGG